MGKRFSLILVAVAATGLIAAGCGSSKKTNTTTSITKAEFVAKADAICAQSNRDIQKAAVAQFGNTPPTQAGLQKLATDTLLPLAQRQADQIRALGAPTGDRNQINAYLSSFETALNTAKGNPSLVLATSKRKALFAQSGQLAQQYGLTVCARP